MENSGRQKFEESWKEAFEDSEMEPSGLVWNNIDQKLDNDKMKRSVVFYQRLAAAAVIFAVLIGVASTSYFQLNRETELASATKTENQKTKQQLSADTKNTTSINKEDNKDQTELATSGTSATSSKEDGSDKNEEAASENEGATQDVATKQYDKQNQSIAQGDEKTSQQLKDKAGDQTNKLIASANGDLLAKNKSTNSLNSSQAAVKSNSVKEKSNADQNDKVNNNATTQPLIAKADNTKNEKNSTSELNQKTDQQSTNKASSKSNASKAKNDTKESNGKDNVTTQPLIAQADHTPNTNAKNDSNKIAAVKSNSSASKNDVAKNKDNNDIVNQSLAAQVDTKEIANSNSDQNGNGVPKKTNTFASSSQNIQSSDNAFSRMASYFSPQLKSNKLPKGIEPEPKRELPAMPASMMASASSDKRSNEDTWLSFGAAAGSYNPGGSSSPTSNTQSSPASSMQQFATNNITNAQAPQNASRSSLGSAYSIGLSFGKKIADRWIVHTGVNYMNQAISYTSTYNTYTASNDRTAFVSDYADKTSAPLAIAQPYKVNSNNEFVSVPVQAGYLIVDRKFGLQWNAGVATDVFLRNTLKDQSGRSDKYTQGSGDASPYRSFNFAALTSTEFSYKLGGQYRISLVPGVRYSFQSVLKSHSGSSNPLVLDIGFRFRYIFNAK